jgi:hypothetical protein
MIDDRLKEDNLRINDEDLLSECSSDKEDEVEKNGDKSNESNNDEKME